MTVLALVTGCSSDVTAAPGEHSATASPSALQASPKAHPQVLTKAPLLVQPQSQLPELKNGCEVTSLSMLLAFAGRPVSKMELARVMPRDPTPAQYRGDGRGLNSVVRWGNPNVGFVGNVDRIGGYGIYHAPLTRLLDSQLPGRALDLSGRPFQDLLDTVADGRPVLAWTTATLKPTENWVRWETAQGPFRATADEHAVLLVGYDASYVYLNNPLTGQAAEKRARAPFIAAWKQLGRQAITITPPVTR